MRRRTLEFILEASSVGVAATALVIVISASIELDGGLHIDLAEGRGIMLLLSVIFIVAGVFLFSRSWSSERVEDEVVDDAEAVLEASPAVGHGDTGREAAPKSPMSEDEGRLYEIITESGGEMLQMHIVSLKVFSKAKVTRLLDKLEKRGLVVRERHGMTNRIRIIR